MLIGIKFDILNYIKNFFNISILKTQEVNNTKNSKKIWTQHIPYHKYNDPVVVLKLLVHYSIYLY